jgi:ABC-type nitrate/sulfonate/bicarbonate transport system substrate-binding protein
MREFVLLLFILPFCFTQCVQNDQVNVQLRWYHQSEFAGYYAAVDKGFYAQQCLNVSISQGDSLNLRY